MVEVKFIKVHPDAKLPVYSTPEAAGADICSVEHFTMFSMERRIIDTGLDCVIPKGWELQVRPRSGLGGKFGVTVLNTPGTIDSDYVGRLKVMLINLGDKPFEISVGDRIAQLVVQPVHRAKFGWATEARDTERGSGGFGSTGVKS